MASKKKILVHTCCASCSSHVLSYLSGRYDVSAFYYNPNIQPGKEYLLRLGEMRLVCSKAGITLYEGEYSPDSWWKCIEPFRHLPEKSKRCWVCYRMRLEETAAKAVELGFDTFTTTLSVSPHKIHKRIVEEGQAAARQYGITFLDEDFKKKDGFKISVEKSCELGLTLHDYCGCMLSLKEAKERKNGRRRAEPS